MEKLLHKVIFLTVIFYIQSDDIDGLGIRQLPGFSDPHKPRTITRGEVGCFLSHYYLWQKMVPGETYLVLEDDVRFGPDFVADLRRTLREAKDINWDLIYVGRKRGPGADNDVEVMVTESISNVTYSFWTLGYLITGDAAKVLVDEKPLVRFFWKKNSSMSSNLEIQNLSGKTYSC